MFIFLRMRGDQMQVKLEDTVFSISPKPLVKKTSHRAPTLSYEPNTEPQTPET